MVWYGVINFESIEKSSDTYCRYTVCVLYHDYLIHTLHTTHYYLLRIGGQQFKYFCKRVLLIKSFPIGGNCNEVNIIINIYFMCEQWVSMLIVHLLFPFSSRPMVFPPMRLRVHSVIFSWGKAHLLFPRWEACSSDPIKHTSPAVLAHCLYLIVMLSFFLGL